ncbi:MAG: YolD-like family protein [Roseburia sp.]|nr:YolD-like family protein [Roseburia sp.]
MGKYDDIIHLPHHVSTKHPQMSALDRAAQFSPFAALTGHGSAIRETARLTDVRLELDENKKEELDECLQMLRMQSALKPEAEITYFVPDAKKEGGSYLLIRGCIKKFDDIGHKIIMENGTIIPVSDIYGIESPFLDYGNNS